MSDDFKSYDDMAEEGERLERALETWLEDHGRSAKKPWPEHEIIAKERRLTWAKKAIEIFRRGSAMGRDVA